MMVNFLNLGVPEISILSSLFLWVALFAVAFVRCVTNNFFTPTEKAVWVLAICLVPFFGALAYLIAYGKGRRAVKIRPEYQKERLFGPN